MSLTSGFYKINSLVQAPSPVGISSDTQAVTQIAGLANPVQVWNVEAIQDRFRLSIGGYPYSGVIDGKVAASKVSEDSVAWHVTFRSQNAVTIELPEDYSKVWTISDTQSSNPEIVIADIQGSGDSTQWFSLQNVD